MSESSAEPPVHELRCSFCRRARAEVRCLVAGPGVSICDACVQLGVQILVEETAEPVPDGATCSFCAKAHPAVEILISGAEALICDECVQLSGEIVGPAITSQLPVARVRRPSWWQRWRRRA